MNLWAVLLTGLLAGGLSCAAVQGGLLTGLVTRQRSAVQTAAAPTMGKGRARKAATRPPRPAAAPKPWWVTAKAELADDLVPVGAFLGGKLVSHTILGLLLGTIGSAVQLSPGVRVWTQLAAGALIVAFGLGQLGVRGFKNFTIAPPASWTRFVRGRARSQAAFAPALLGMATILVPCGITLSVMTLALTSGSAWTGAAIMATFVIGTGPLFTLIGYAAKRAATAWQGRLAVLTGVVILGLGLYTFNGGLTLADSPLAVSNLPQTLGLVAPPAVADASVVQQAADGRQQLVVTARSESYSPANIAAKSGVPTTLILRSQKAQGCIRSFVIPSLDKQWTLPVNGDTTIDLGVLKPGTLRYSCGMGMYTGQITIT